MKVKCIATKLSQVDLSPAEMTALDITEVISDHTEGEYVYGLGKEFVVYGVELRNNVPFYFICEEKDDTYPVPLFYGCFEIVDDRFSSEWRLINEKGSGQNQNIIQILPRVWAENPMFYENLLEEHSEEIEAFRLLRIQLESEYS